MAGMPEGSMRSKYPGELRDQVRGVPEGGGHRRPLAALTARGQVSYIG